MKKLLVAFNATNYSSSLAQFAIAIARESNSVIHAVFLSPSLVPVTYPFPNDLPLASTGLISTVEMIEESEEPPTGSLTHPHLHFRIGMCGFNEINKGMT